MTRCAAVLTRRPLVSISRAPSSSSSATSRPGCTATPGPIMHNARGLKMPAGLRWTAKRPCSLTTVWPAFAPPWPRITRSASRASKLMTLPLPSSPQCPPTTAVTGTALLYHRADYLSGLWGPAAPLGPVVAPLVPRCALLPAPTPRVRANRARRHWTPMLVSRNTDSDTPDRDTARLNVLATPSVSPDETVVRTVRPVLPHVAGG